MAILGSQGYLRLRREAPEPLVLSPDAINRTAKAFRSGDQDFWTGDEVYLFAPNGLPISNTSAPEGSGIYAGGKWDVGPNREHVVDDDDLWWLQAGEDAPGPPDGDPVAGDGAWFYNRGPAIKSGSYFVYVDQLGRIALYTNRRSAMNGLKDDRLPLFVVDFGLMLMAAAGTEDYDNAFVECLDKVSALQPGEIQDSITLAELCSFSPTYEKPLAGTGDFNDADVQPRNRIGAVFPWEFLCEMRAWTLETNGAAVDTTTVGQKFGDSVKSLVTGGGTIDFMVDRIYENDQERDTTALMRLVLMTEKGSKASAQFFFVLNRPGGKCDSKLAGDLFYEADLLMTNVALNVRPDEVVAAPAPS